MSANQTSPNPTRIRNFDPGREHGLGHRALSTLLRSASVRELGMAAARHADPLLSWLITSPLGPRLAMPLGILTTIGARSGQPRSVAVFYLSDGQDTILIGSNFGGARNPAWVYNLRANPEATMQVGPVITRFLAVEIVDPEEHTRVYALAEQAYPGYPGYKVKAAAAGRMHIPLMRLRPVA